MEFINDIQSPAPCGAYSHAVRSGNFLFISGQVPFDPATGNVVGSDISEQTTQTMKNLVSILNSSGLTLDNIVKTTVYLANWDDFSGFNTVYADYLGAHKPARASVEVRRIAKDALLEIEAIAEIS